MSEKGYIYNQSKDSTKANILIDGEISAWWGTGLQDLAFDISNSGANEIMLQINSGGGSVFEGQAIANYIKGSPYNINTCVVGFCGSIATMFAMEGKSTSIAMYSRFMIHNVTVENMSGGSDELRNTAAFIDTLNLDIRNRYVSTMSRNGKLINGSIEETQKKVKEWMDSETYFTAEEAVKYGFIQKVVDGAEYLNKANAQKILNSCSKYKNVPTDFINNIQNIVNMADDKPNNSNAPEEKQTAWESFKAMFTSAKGQALIAESVQNAKDNEAKAIEDARALLAKEGLEVVAKTEKVEEVVEEKKEEKTQLEILQAKLEAAELKAQKLAEEAEGAPTARTKELEANAESVYTKEEMKGFAGITNALQQR